ncbi:MAG: hypothetical protein PF501_15410 [Salinisphaera sp.]|jgi:hypothetical protein|nr:hypothetical protein [Salinisphaera sp.]
MGHIRSIGVAGLLALSLAACNSGGNSGSGGNLSPAPPTASNLYAPVSATPQLPFPNDLLFADSNNMSGALAGFSADATLNVPDATGANPLIQDANLLDGFSTTDNLYTDFDGANISLDSANAGGVRVIDLTTGDPLVAGTDFDVIRSAATVNDTRLLIRPLKPLSPDSVYAVVVTTAMKTTDGGAVLPSDQFRIVSSASAVGSKQNPAKGYSAAQQAQLEQIRESAVRPVLVAARISAADAVVAWRFTTQSIGTSLRYLAAHPTPNPNRLADGGLRVKPLPDGKGGQLSTGEAIPGAPDTANLYQGTVDLSYYLADANSNDANNNGQTPLTTYWASNGKRALGNSTLRMPNGGSVPCAVVAPSKSTTGCYPQPERRSIQSVPVLVAVPNANSPSGGTPPTGGWPVVIFQHGITANRTNMFAVAPALAAAGFVTVAIDLPLHGLKPTNPLAIKGAERTFDLDANGDGVIDSSGANFINLTSPITSRDNNREAVADLIDLSATVREGQITVLGGGANIQLNGKAPQYFGHSLGAIVGSTLMGVTDSRTFDAATLANPGGGIIRLLDGSAAFGPVISQGLAAAGISEGSQNYQTFLRLAQTIVDGADPINYAKAASQQHALHMIEVVGGGNGGMNPPDLVVPNAVPANIGPNFMASVNGSCPQTSPYTPTLDAVCVGGPLSGTDPLATAMGLNRVSASIPYQAKAQPADSVIRFDTGAHGTVLDPTSGTASGGVSPQDGVTTNREMQCEAASFLAQAAAGSSSPTIPLGCSNSN